MADLSNQRPKLSAAKRTYFKSGYEALLSRLMRIILTVEARAFPGRD